MPATDDLRQSARRVGWLARAVLLVLASSLSAAKGTATSDLIWLALLIPLAGLVGDARRSPQVGLAVVTMESCATAVAVLATGSDTSVFLPYLLAPAFTGALLMGVRGALAPPLAAALTLIVGRTLPNDVTSTRDFVAAVALWVILSGFVGLVTAWVSHIATTAAAADPQAAQRAAYDLLSRLRTVARRLPGTLDPASTAEALLRSAREVSDFTDGAVLVRSPGGARLVPLARSGEQRPNWDLSISADGPISDAWLTQQVQLRGQRLRRDAGGAPSGSSLVVPLSLGLRSLGLLVLETDRPRAWSAAQAQQLERMARDVSLQLESGLLFDEVRALATTEERNRVAREIHDGIAQELVFLGYSIDNLVVEAAAPSADLGESLRVLRDEVTRLVSELRLSLFDLRSDIDAGAGLGTVLTNYLRTVGTQTGLTVHLSLSESAARLPSAVEVELLRITQEAVSNVRKHAQASNLWLVCVVDPPSAAIILEDDGIGVTEAPRPGSFGVSIMRERAERLGADFRMMNRVGGGTVVEVRLGRMTPGRSTVSGIITPTEDVHADDRAAGG